MLVNNVYFRREEGATLQLCEVREIGIFLKKGTEFLPGRLGLDCNRGTVLLLQLSLAECNKRTVPLLAQKESFPVEKLSWLVRDGVMRTSWPILSGY